MGTLSTAAGAAAGAAEGAAAGAAPAAARMTVGIVGGFFDYTAAHDGRVAWYPNFAHSLLFVAWNTPLLAQDELQALEFPALVSLRLALLHEAPQHARTRGADGLATPILIQGVQRRCAIDTTTSPSIYGNAFSRASETLVRSRVTVLPSRVTVLPTATGTESSVSNTSNIYAFEAPTPGRGVYSYAQIKAILKTAYTTFRAIVLMHVGGQHSWRERGGGNEQGEGGVGASSGEGANIQRAGGVGGAGGAAEDGLAELELHLGYWGCGAYGGNRVLMVLLQLLAAQLAGVPHAVVHFPPGFERDARTALQLVSQAPLGQDLNALLVWLCSLDFKWGQSDGN
jgi:hypothetical protein